MLLRCVFFWAVEFGYFRSLLCFYGDHGHGFGFLLVFLASVMLLLVTISFWGS